MKWLELIGGLGLAVILAAGVYFLITRLKWDGDEQRKPPTDKDQSK